MLTNPVFHALAGPHSGVAEVRGDVRRYRAEVAPFLGLPDEVGEQDWLDTAELVGSGHTAAVIRPDLVIPDLFKISLRIELLQFVAPAGLGADDPEITRLGLDDVPEMLALVALTDPGPFRSRTIELGNYLGIRREGKLIAMAGERFRLPGFTEISAVCTDPEYRGQGLATRLIRAVAAGIERDGSRPFLHTGAGNAKAIRIYESLGFTISNRPAVTVIEPV